MQSSFFIMLLAVSLCAHAALTRSTLIPPGNVWTIAHTAATLSLLICAGAAGWRGLRWYEALILGAFGGACFDVWWPDRRDYIGMRFGGPGLADYLLTYFGFIAAVATACAIIAESAWMLRRRFPRPRDRCKTCDYRLIGLTTPRCPECGTPFDSPAIPLETTNFE